MLIGMSIGSSSSNLGLVIVQAISGGTFIYIAIFDLLIHEFHLKKDKSNLLKFASTMLGSAIVLALIAATPEH